MEIIRSGKAPAFCTELPVEREELRRGIIRLKPDDKLPEKPRRKRTWEQERFRKNLGEFLSENY